MIQIQYFARLSEQLKTRSESLDIEQSGNTVKELVTVLCQRGENWETALNGTDTVLVAVNHEMCNREQVITDGDEVAFFPPVTGG